VEADRDLIEVETNKATMNVTSPCRGKIAGFSVELNESYPVGASWAASRLRRKTGARRLRHGGAGQTSRRCQRGSERSSPQPERKTVEPTIRGLPVPAHAAGASFMSPRLKARMAELGLHAADLAGIAGSGAGGASRIQDFEHFIASIEKHKQSLPPACASPWPTPCGAVGRGPSPQWDCPCARRVVRAPQSVQSQAGPGPLCASRPGDGVGREQRTGRPAHRQDDVHPSSIDLGFAVKRRMVCLCRVIRRADQKSLKDLLPRYNELIELCHQRKLPVEAAGGSIGIVTNFGTFGLMWATPIPLPEQTLVLGVGAARKMPAWDEAKGQFVPVMEANFTLSFDHRFLDGGAAGRLLTRIAAL